MLVLLLLLKIFSVFSLTFPFLISVFKVHLNVNSAMKLIPSYWIGTPKPLMMCTFFSTPFLPVLDREMEPLGSVTYIGIYIWIDAYIWCVCVYSLSLYPIIISCNKVIFYMQLAHVMWRLTSPKICTVSWNKLELQESRCVCVCVCERETQLCLTLCNPMDCSPPGFSVHGIPQGRILEWVARDLPDPGIESRFPALQVGSLPSEPPGKTDGVVVLSKSHFPLCSSSACNTFVSNSLYFIPSI